MRRGRGSPFCDSRRVDVCGVGRVARGLSVAESSKGFECGWKPLEGVRCCFGASMQAAQAGGERVKGTAVPGSLGWGLA